MHMPAQSAATQSPRTPGINFNLGAIGRVESYRVGSIGGQHQNVRPVCGRDDSLAWEVATQELQVKVAGKLNSHGLPPSTYFDIAHREEGPRDVRSTPNGRHWGPGAICQPCRAPSAQPKTSAPRTAAAALLASPTTAARPRTPRCARRSLRPRRKALDGPCCYAGPVVAVLAAPSLWRHSG